MKRSAAVFQAPRQQRSRRTLETILHATEVLLRTRPLREIGVDAILRRARCSAGSFYARFRSKEDLLPLLYQRYDSGLRSDVDARLRLDGADARGLAETVERLVSEMVDAYAQRRHLLREMALFARAWPEAIGPEMRRRRRDMHELPVRLLARFKNRIPHPDPEQAIRVASYVAAAAVRDKVLFGDAPHAALTRLSRAELKRSLSQMLIAFLETPPPRVKEKKR